MKKITKFSKSVVIAVCLLVVIFLLAFHAVRHLIIKDKEALVYSIAHSLLPMLLVNDKQQLDRTIKALEIHPSIQEAQLLNFDGMSLSSYSRLSEFFGVMAPLLELASAANNLNQVNVIVPISFHGLVVASFHVVVNLWPTYLRILSWLALILILPSIIYVLVKQFRIKLRFEIVGSGGDCEPFDTQNAVSVAMRDASISIEYQSINQLNNGRIWGMEALVCWRHPSGQTLHVTSSEFLAVAENLDACLPFDDWFFTTACSQAAAWQHQYGPLILTFSITGSQFYHPLFAKKVRSICKEAQLPYQLLELELNESFVLTHPQHALMCLNRFIAEGLSVTINHFGLFRRSIELLSMLPIRKVKLHPQLVKCLRADDQVAELIQTIVSRALINEIQVVSEGIDREEQSANLQKIGSTLGQGTYFDLALAANNFETMLSSQLDNVLRQRCHV